MPLPLKVQLVPPDPRWPSFAKIECARICAAAAPAILRVHHIGSTAVPGLAAKPILDLLAVAAGPTALDAAVRPLEALGFVCRGEHGLIGRRYHVLNDLETGARRVQLHCYAEGDPSILRHLAFRDFLYAQPNAAQDYARERARCAAAAVRSRKHWRGPGVGRILVRRGQRARFLRVANRGKLAQRRHRILITNDRCIQPLYVRPKSADQMVWRSLQRHPVVADFLRAEALRWRS